MHSPRFLPVVVFLFALILSVSSTPLLGERTTSKCTARDLAIIKRTVSDETYFCKWWLSNTRTRSPFLEFTTAEVTNLCKCIAPVSKTTTKKKRAEPTVDLSLQKRQTTASCIAELAIQFTEPNHFCTFYNAYLRTTSPFAKYSAKSLTTLCNCVEGKVVSTSTKKSSTTSKKSSTTSKKSSTTSKKSSTTSKKSSTTSKKSSTTSKKSSTTSKKSSTTSKKVSTTSTKKISTTSSIKTSSKSSSSSSYKSSSKISQIISSTIIPSSTISLSSTSKIIHSITSKTSSSSTKASVAISIASSLLSLPVSESLSTSSVSVPISSSSISFSSPAASSSSSSEIISTIPEASQSPTYSSSSSEIVSSTSSSFSSSEIISTIPEASQSPTYSSSSSEIVSSTSSSFSSSSSSFPSSTESPSSTPLPTGYIYARNSGRSADNTPLAGYRGGDDTLLYFLSDGSNTGITALNYTYDPSTNRVYLGADYLLCYSKESSDYSYVGSYSISSINSNSVYQPLPCSIDAGTGKVSCVAPLTNGDTAVNFYLDENAYAEGRLYMYLYAADVTVPSSLYAVDWYINQAEAAALASSSSAVSSSETPSSTSTQASSTSTSDASSTITETASASSSSFSADASSATSSSSTTSATPLPSGYISIANTGTYLDGQVAKGLNSGANTLIYLNVTSTSSSYAPLNYTFDSATGYVYLGNGSNILCYQTNYNANYTNVASINLTSLATTFKNSYAALPCSVDPVTNKLECTASSNTGVALTAWSLYNYQSYGYSYLFLYAPNTTLPTWLSNSIDLVAIPSSSSATTSASSTTSVQSSTSASSTTATDPTPV